MDVVSNPHQMQAQSSVNVFKILFVDNQKGLDREVNKLLEKTQNTSGPAVFQPVFVPDVKEALLKLTKEAFSLVVLEITLPIVNGYYLLDLLSQSSQKIPVIVYTRLMHGEDLEKVSHYGVDNLFLKNLTSIEQLFEFIQEGNYKVDLTAKLKELNDSLKGIKEEEAEKTSKFTQCPRCHLVLSPKAHFCNNCGQKIFKKTSQLVEKAPQKLSPETDLSQAPQALPVTPETPLESMTENATEQNSSSSEAEDSDASENEPVAIQ